MLNRRILSLWFPRLAVERLLRQQRTALPRPVAVVAEEANTQRLASLNPEAEAVGLRLGQSLPGALAVFPALVTYPADPAAEALFLSNLRRWAGRFSPWVAEHAPASLMVDLTGCAHLFGGEAALMDQAAEDCADLGLTVRLGLADTPGAAWALARYAGRLPEITRSGDAIEQEARATRARAVKRRHWERGGAAPGPAAPDTPTGRIAAPGQLREALAPLPLAALRLPPETIEQLSRLGLRQVEDLMTLPRAGLSRRFGLGVLRRLDQALGVEREPVGPARPRVSFAVRLTFPDPIGLRDDILAGIDRLLPVLAEKLRVKGRGARRIRLSALCNDHRTEVIEIGLARALSDPAQIRPLLALKVDQIDPGFGIDTLRLEALLTEPVYDRQHRGPPEFSATPTRASAAEAFSDLLSRLGTRVGLEEIIRLHPAESHIPEKSALILAAVYSEPAGPWPQRATPRPLILFTAPEPVTVPEGGGRPSRLRWRRRDLVVTAATGPERLAPEWWLDDPAWRSGVRDYWQVEVEVEGGPEGGGGARLWLFQAHGGEISGGWFCHGEFG